ncbi:hypothetical protein ACROYT_G024342 [Oculina patagonica]
MEASSEKTTCSEDFSKLKVDKLENYLRERGIQLSDGGKGKRKAELLDFCQKAAAMKQRKLDDSAKDRTKLLKDKLQTSEGKLSDPNTKTKSAWTHNFSKIPEFTFRDLYNYLSLSNGEILLTQNEINNLEDIQPRHKSKMKRVFLILAVMFLVFDCFWAVEKDAVKFLLDGNHANSFLAHKRSVCSYIQDLTDKMTSRAFIGSHAGMDEVDVHEECCVEQCNTEEMDENLYLALYGDMAQAEMWRERYMNNCC